MINTHSPSPSQQKSLPSRGPRFNQQTGLRRRDSELPLHQLSPNGHRGTWKLSKSKDSAKHQIVAGSNKLHERVQEATKKKLRNNPKRTSTKPKRGIFPSKSKHSSQIFTVNAKRKLANQPGNGNHSKYAIHLPLPRLNHTRPQSANVRSLHPDIKPCMHKCAPDGPKLERLIGQTYNRQVRASERMENNSISGAGAEREKDFMADWCEISHDKAFTEAWNWTRAEILPWFSSDDVEKIHLLSRGTVLSKARIPGHGQVLQVGLSGYKDTLSLSGSHNKLCQAGHCVLVKRPNDWFEVFAFHLDRVLGLNRSLPAVLRTFHSDLLPYKYTNGSPRPVVWWDPDIQHLADDENDQNSFSLTWPMYQALLRTRCGTYVPLNSSKCVGVHHSEWARLALFDFLLQVRC